MVLEHPTCGGRGVAGARLLEVGDAVGGVDVDSFTDLGRLSDESARNDSPMVGRFPAVVLGSRHHFMTRTTCGAGTNFYVTSPPSLLYPPVPRPPHSSQLLRDRGNFYVTLYA